MGLTFAENTWPPCRNCWNLPFPARLLFAVWLAGCNNTEEDDEAGKPNMATEFWAEGYTKKSMERAAHILDLIDEKWPATSEQSLKTQAA